LSSNSDGLTMGR